MTGTREQVIAAHARRVGIRRALRIAALADAIFSWEYSPARFEYSLLPIRFPWVLRKLWFAQDSVAFFLRRKI